MTIKTKILVCTLPFFLLFGLVSMLISINSLKGQSQKSLASIHEVMVRDKNEKLTDLVSNTYEIIAAQYRAAHDPSQVAETYRRELESIINLAYSTIESVAGRTDLGEAEKQQEAMRLVGAMRYGGDNYLWINDLQPVMVMHPIKPAMNGQSLADYKDPNGKKLFVEMVKVAGEKGQGFVDYMWPKPGQDKPVAKLSFVRLFKPWNWVIGTGVYLEAAELRFQEEAKKQIANLRFGPEGKDYFFILDTKATIVMHPLKPEMNGKNYADYADPTGKKIFSAMVDTVRDNNGQGFVDYMWEKPGETEPVGKVSFVKLFREWGWIVGTGIYRDDIDKAMAEQGRIVAAAIDKQRLTIIGVSLGMILLVGIVLTFVAHRLAAPIKQASLMLQDIAQGEGDLTRRLVVSTRDELADMAKWFNVFVEKLQKIIKDIGVDSREVLNSSLSLADISATMSTGATDTSDKSQTVAAAAEEMSANMATVAGSMDQTAASVDVVSAAVEEMTSTISEIAQTAENARRITDQAVAKSAAASSRVEELGAATKEISKVLETIAEISDQVDLLALNATIEAARAGDAGKGFAVVASEIKELAKQTSAAAGQIRERIEGIQRTTDATVREIEGISGVVGENSEIVNTIATAVEEQSVTATEIAKSVGNILMGIQEMNGNIAESAQVSGDIAREIAEVNTASLLMSENATLINENAGKLNSLAEGFARMVGRFKV